MGPLVGATELSKALVDAGNNLLKSHSSTDATLTLLDEIESLLATVEQDPISSVQNALIPSMKALVSADLLRNPDSDVRVSVVSCLTEIMRITAPEAPYNDDQMEEIFKVTIEAFGKLADVSGRSYKKAENVLETVSKVRSSLVMLDLECDDLVLEMFRQFLKVIRPDHSQLVPLAMETVMITVIDESEEVPMDLLEILLTTVEKNNQDVSPTALRLVEKVLSSCACKLQPCIMEALKSKGTSLNMYSPVVSSICEGKYTTFTQAHDVAITKEKEEDEKISEEKIFPSDLLKDKLDLGVSRNHKGSRSKRTARSGTHQANGDDKVRTGIDLKQLLKHGQSESSDAETKSDSTRKRGRKPNSLMNPEEGYLFKTSSSKKMQDNEVGDSALRKVAAKKASLPSKVGQTNQSVVISRSPSGMARTGSSRKRSRTKMEETNNDGVSCATPTSKEQVVNKDDTEEENLMESNLEKSKDGIKTSKSTKKEKAQNGLAKISAKKPLAETKMIKSSGKKSALSDAEKKNSEGASMDTSIPQSSKSKKKKSRAAMPSVKKAEQTPKSHPKRKRTSEEEVESVELGEKLVGKRVKVLWPLDKTFYEGVIESYSSCTKMHRVLYSDGDSEELDMKNEQFEIIKDISSASKDEEIDLPESIPLSDLIQRVRSKKRKNASLNVKQSSSPEVRSSKQRTKKEDSVANSSKQTKRTKGVLKTVSNEPESKEGKSLKSLKELKGESGKTKGRTGKKQKLTLAIRKESDKDCDEKEDPESNGLDSLQCQKEMNAESDCLGVHRELPENQIAETKTDEEKQKYEKESPKTDGGEHNSLKGPNAEPKTNGEEQEAADEATAEPKSDEEERNEAKETNAEPERDEEECKSPKEAYVEPNTEGKEQKSVEEPTADPEIKVEEKESEKKQHADTKLIENKDMCEAKRQEINKGTCTSIHETGKIENEADEDGSESNLGTEIRI